MEVALTGASWVSCPILTLNLSGRQKYDKDNYLDCTRRYPFVLCGVMLVLTRDVSYD